MESRNIKGVKMGRTQRSGRMESVDTTHQTSDFAEYLRSRMDSGAYGKECVGSGSKKSKKKPPQEQRTIHLMGTFSSVVLR